MFGSVIVSSGLLNRQSDSLANADTHRCQTAFGVGSPVEFVDGRGQEPGTRTAQRVPDGDRTTVGIESLVFGVKPPLGTDTERLSGERLVELNKMNVHRATTPDDQAVWSWRALGQGP